MIFADPPYFLSNGGITCHAGRMVSVHNSYMYIRLMADIRAHISAGTFGQFRREFVANYVPSQRVLQTRGITAVRGADE